MKAKGYAAKDQHTSLTPFQFERRDVQEKDILIDIMYCGVCHSDIHQVRNEWGNSIYPMVPGHEIVGEITKIGSKVTRFKVGETVGVGCFVDSCRTCSHCQADLQQYCDQLVATYNSYEKDHKTSTFGGYSNCIVVEEPYVLKIDSHLDLSKVAPLLCAGITTYSPLRHWKVSKGQKVGILGLGGLGHMGVKFAHAFGAHVVVFTTSPQKIEDAKRLGAHEVVITKNNQEIEKHLDSFDFILNTISASIDLNIYLNLLKREGTMVLLGVPSQDPSIQSACLIHKRRQLAGSLIGGIAETQEMLDFCAKHNITSDVEMIPIQKINEAYERTMKGDVKYRFVIDMKSLD